ncbi:hypothetical protein [Paenisporosarcina cavernae]|uniref:Uncharacterized protein n=1 Tax=Paenisporosarcina cavernae TaxID=2320858 RepID=A0A385YSV8_9BACL|nr:hypothetical protein [Paenisporosarcina cavernae]AYC28732.1 hypothetical protein D3873_02160 [Paenisporosarcina cavernae]
MVVLFVLPRKGELMTEVQVAEKIASSEYVFAILFIIMLFIAVRWFAGHLKEMKQENQEREKELKDLYTEHKEESKEREKLLLRHLENSNESQAKTAEAIKKMSDSMKSIEQQMDTGFKEVWRAFKGGKHNGNRND